MDDLGDRMKMYESRTTSLMCMPRLPICARIDGKCFHSYTRGMRRPFDERLSGAMIDVTKTLVKLTSAIIGYTQSDEITLIWYYDDFKSQPWFDGKIQKMTSVLASMTTAYFNISIRDRFGDDAPKNPAIFDCRVWDVPNLEEAANVLLWRELDATKNAISMAAREFFSSKELHGKNGKEMQEMIFQKAGVNFDKYPSFFKRGTFVRRKESKQILTVEDVSKRKLPKEMIGKEFVRTDVVEMDLPKLSTIKDRVGTLFQNNS